jgi:glycerol-3-phosphate cytidylyltransferase-like family protein
VHAATRLPDADILGTQMTMEERLQVVAACRYVDEVIPDAPLVVTRDWIEEHAVDLVVHGDDLPEETLMLMYRVPHELGILRLVPYTAGISTSDLIERVRRAVVERPDPP